MTLRKLNEDDVVITVNHEIERFDLDYTLYRFDHDVKSEILERLKKGDTWAWCTVTVTVTFGPFSASDSLGACSYDNEEDFKSDGYFPDMIDTALHELDFVLAKTMNKLNTLNR